MVHVSLPIDEVLDELITVLSVNGKAILIAPPGAGKTTRVPLACLDVPWLTGKKIIMLEPRRLSARSAATFMAEQRGERVGETVGYRVRNDTVVGPTTRIEVVTEGVLTRMLQSDPTLSGIGLVIFDEFHERNLHADVGLALCLQSQAVFDSDFRLLLMSATMNGEMLSNRLGAPVISSIGKMYPVDTIYLNTAIESHREEVWLHTIERAFHEQEGDMLVFLPGVAEISRIERALQENGWANYANIHTLHGGLTHSKQDEALWPAINGRRKIVLTTPIAETGLTVKGVRIVIDSGLVRTPQFSAKTGMTRLETAFVSRASADQRRGRAGRTSSGVCYRLWTEEKHRQLAAEPTPEIENADLSPLALELAEWGAKPEELIWITPPPKAHYEQAIDLLVRLGALNNSGATTEQGTQMLKLGVQPRLAHMILRALPIGLGRLACHLTALLGERDPIRGESARNADIRLRMDLLRTNHRNDHSDDIDFSTMSRIREDAQKLQRQFSHLYDSILDTSTNNKDIESCGLLLSFAYPDRIAAERGGKYLLSGGRGAQLRKDQPLSREPYLVAVALDDAGMDSRIDLAAPIRLDDLLYHHQDRIREDVSIIWDHDTHAVKATKRAQLGAITLKENPLLHTSPEKLLTAFLAGVATEGLEVLPWTKSSLQLRQRIMSVHTLDPTWPDLSNEQLTSSLHDWLGPFVSGFRSLNDLKKLSMHDMLESMLSWDQRNQLGRLAPTHLQVPSGSRIAIDYSNPSAPFLAVRLQELFGMAETPRIVNGKLPLTFHLLSPAQRPVQITRDLASFWRETYFEVKKDLKGRYPKHYWPDDPLQAIPTNRTRPRN